jgi:hypothetical protein
MHLEFQRSRAVLREILDVTQDDPATKRRWFHDDDFDLFVRESDRGLAAFELCYGMKSNERALVWMLDKGYFHDGETSQDFIGAKLAAGGALEDDPVIARFTLSAGGLPRDLRVALEARLREFAVQRAEGAARRTRFRRAGWQQKKSG